MQNYTMQQLATLPLLLRSLRTQRLEEPSRKLKKKLVPKLGFDGKVDWRVVADARVKGAAT